MTGWWRLVYYTMGWDYPKDQWCEKQRYLKYYCCKELLAKELKLDHKKPVFKPRKTMSDFIKPRPKKTKKKRK